MRPPRAVTPLLAPAVIDFHGHKIALRPSGALYFPDLALLAVADLHLGKATHFSALGRFLPPYEADATLEKLDREAQATGARKILLLGDTFHSALVGQDPQFLPRIVDSISRRAPALFVAGNHDRTLARMLKNLGLDLHDSWRLGEPTPLLLLHQPTASQEAQIFGHFHPCATVSTRAGRQRRRCFVVGQNHIVMPSFGSLTGGLDVETAALAPYARNLDLYLI
ncbi:ligase-associated DNA damage response endonuclease PdeM [uncultured Rhodoblastus sp.]|uniref:ligase-associated DNA damage response endonuclease PdeM n=1 Tax=uncultured Rhodoblastus sp. TaxID=543037 RepID=UPI0025DEFF0D|nr:ligase-associated DNA damage response endonuclease PdeM [uncultured Rhodoblastus sp.]